MARHDAGRHVATRSDGLETNGKAANEAETDVGGSAAQRPKNTARAFARCSGYSFRVLRESTQADRAFRRTLRGARLASISVLAGAIATLASLVGVAYVATVGSQAGAFDAHALRFASHGTLDHTVGTRAHSTHDEKSQRASLHSVQERRIGGIVLVDVGSDVISLDDELEAQRDAALRDGGRVVVWLIVEDCKMCGAIEAALESSHMQDALTGTRIVRLDAADFIAELSRIGVPLDAFPGFVLLDAGGRASDYLHADEWDDDIPQSIAPVLKSFVDGTYVKRRMPWRGGLHEDETPI